MNTESSSAEDKGVESSNALVPTTQQATKTLVLSAIKSALADTSRSIGVSRNWLVKHVEQLALKEEEVVTLVMVKTEFGGMLPHAVKFLYRGLTVDDVYGCYRAQRALATMSSAPRHNASVTKIAKLIRAFAEADPDNENLYVAIAEAHQVISERYFWVRYVDQSISILCAIAEEYGCATIDAALSMVESRHPKQAGMVAGDEGEEDEVERHRQEYEDAHPERYHH